MVHVVVPAVDSYPASACSSRSRDFADRSRSVGKLQQDSKCQPTVVTDNRAAENCGDRSHGS